MKNVKITTIFFSRYFLIALFIFLISIILSLNILDNTNITKFKEKRNINTDKNDEYFNEENYRKDIIIKGYMDKKLLALTFDDGPGKYTEFLLDILKEKNVVATFFVLGSNAEIHPSILTKIVERNELGVHSYVHKLFTKLKNEQILEQIDKTENIINENTNITSNLIRVPYGSINKRVKKLLSDNNYTSVLWSIDSKDWSFRNADKVYNYVMKKIRGNDIILMHDIYLSSVNAASKLIDTLSEEGYIFVTISELLEVENLKCVNE